MIAPSQMEHQGQGKIGMANESESLFEVALGRPWANWLIPKALGRKPQLPG
jgi:hypothetical protein